MLAQLTGLQALSCSVRLGISAGITASGLLRLTALTQLTRLSFDGYIVHSCKRLQQLLHTGTQLVQDKDKEGYTAFEDKVGCKDIKWDFSD